MFDLEKAVGEWRQQMQRAGLHRPEVLEELEAHLREQTDRLKQTGMLEAKAFHTASNGLGDGASLTREFSKISYRAWSLSGHNLFVIAIAVWFILAGTNGILTTLFLPHLGRSFDYVMAILILLFSLQIAIGVGLLRRGEWSRKAALGWARCVLLLLLLVEVSALFHVPQTDKGFWNLLYNALAKPAFVTVQFQFYQVFWLPLPMAWWKILSWTNVGILLFACLKLRKTSVHGALAKLWEEKYV